MRCGRRGRLHRERGPPLARPTAVSGHPDNVSSGLSVVAEPELARTDERESSSTTCLRCLCTWQQRRRLCPRWEREVDGIEVRPEWTEKRTEEARADPRSNEELIRICLAGTEDQAWEAIVVLHFRATRSVFDAAHELCLSE